MTAPALIRHTVAVALTDPAAGGPLPAVAGALVYDPAWDPWTVELWVLAAVRWPIARDMLALGTHRLAGRGAVTIAPEDDDRVTVIRLAAPRDVVELRVDTATVTGFLAETFAAVPSGDEADRVDVDARAAELGTR